MDDFENQILAELAQQARETAGGLKCPNHAATATLHTRITRSGLDIQVEACCEEFADTVLEALGADEEGK